MQKTMARRQLDRLFEMVSSASIARVLEDRGLLLNDPVLRAAAADRVYAEEVLAVAQERGWTLQERKPYAWRLVAGISDVQPRLARIIGRDLFELDGICREADDDEVSSLAVQLQAERRQFLADLVADAPTLNLPGAK